MSAGWCHQMGLFSNPIQSFKRNSVLRFYFSINHFQFGGQTLSSSRFLSCLNQCFIGLSLAGTLSVHILVQNIHLKSIKKNFTNECRFPSNAPSSSSSTFNTISTLEWMMNRPTRCYNKSQRKCLIRRRFIIKEENESNGAKTFFLEKIKKIKKNFNSRALANLIACEAAKNIWNTVVVQPPVLAFRFSHFRLNLVQTLQITLGCWARLISVFEHTPIHLTISQRRCRQATSTSPYLSWPGPIFRWGRR